MTAFTVAPGSLAVQYARAADRLEQDRFADALWQRRLDVWTSDHAVQAKIGNRLGWLDTPGLITSNLARLRSFADAVAHEPLSDVVLLGMGGSSLAPEVLRQVLGQRSSGPRFSMLDSVDPDAVRARMGSAATSLFLFASKSGSTIEPNVMAAEAQERLRQAGVTAWGTRFVAITDPGTDLHRRAQAQSFRDVFVNPADIGGRYSALSFFGMVPAALLGVDLEALLAAARAMENACRSTTVADNPGLALGAFMAAGALAGRDKLTLLVPDRLASFGLWVEQLVAESTGKQGKGIVPIAGETRDARFGSDRIAVAVNVGDEQPDATMLAQAKQASLPLVTLQMSALTDIGAEFFRWEVATATAGFLLGINPFDEPNVQQAKDATRALLDVYQRQGRLPVGEAHASTDGATATLSTAAVDGLQGESAFTFLNVLQQGDYFGLLAYLPPDDAAFDPVLRDFRMRVAARTGCATMFGYGPRYLHSTGQLHKGGANNGVFLVITAAAADDLPVPGERFSFGVLEMAQAIGDFQSLDRTGRRAMHLHLPRRDAGFLSRVLSMIG